MPSERPKKGQRIVAYSMPSIALFIWSDHILKALDWFFRFEKKNLDFGHFRSLFGPLGVAAYRDLAKIAKIRILQILKAFAGGDPPPKSRFVFNLFFLEILGNWKQKIKNAGKKSKRLDANILKKTNAALDKKIKRISYKAS